MLKIPLPSGGVFAVIEPGNIQRLKEGMPMSVGDVMIAFTPDMQRFAEMLGVSGAMPSRGEERIDKLKRPLTPEDIQAALKACQQLPEVIR